MVMDVIETKYWELINQGLDPETAMTVIREIAQRRGKSKVMKIIMKRLEYALLVNWREWPRTCEGSKCAHTSPCGNFLAEIDKSKVGAKIMFYHLV